MDLKIIEQTFKPSYFLQNKLADPEQLDQTILELKIFLANSKNVLAFFSNEGVVIGA